MMKNGLLAAALACVTVASAACKDSTGSTPQVTAGSLAFSYSGALTGSFAANGILTHRDTSFVKQPFAAGVKLVGNSGQNVVGILSYMPVSASTGHEVIFIFPFASAGQTVNLTKTCTSANCPLAGVAFNVNPDLVDDDSDPFFFTSGSLHITSTSNRRIAGTFSGTAEDSLGTRTITVTNGEFDVPYESQSAYPTADRSVWTPAFLRARKN